MRRSSSLIGVVLGVALTITLAACTKPDNPGWTPPPSTTTPTVTPTPDQVLEAIAIYKAANSALVDLLETKDGLGPDEKLPAAFAGWLDGEAYTDAEASARDWRTGGSTIVSGKIQFLWVRENTSLGYLDSTVTIQGCNDARGVKVKKPDGTVEPGSTVVRTYFLAPRDGKLKAIYTDTEQPWSGQCGDQSR